MSTKRFPYKYGSDLHWLWGWGHRLDLRMQSDRPLGHLDSFIFRPDRLAADALDRMGTVYPHIARQIQEHLDHAEKCYANLDERDESAANLGESMHGLRRRILGGVEAIIDAPHTEAINSGKRIAKRGKHGAEKWRGARSKMIGLLDTNKLPKTLRQAQKLLDADGFKNGTVMTAAHRSERLRKHFNLPDPPEQDESGTVLDELSGTMARQFNNLPEDTRQAVESEWKTGDKQKALDWVMTLSVNPDAGRTGDFALIENADRDGRE
jgi:hypothetical protein